MINLINEKYGRLTVINEAERVNKRRMWLCLCNCGNIHIVSADGLKSGRTKSCGCYNVEVAKLRRITHGLTESSEYVAWESMKTRCTNKKSEKYPDYGERGIKVCDRWLNSFENFYADMGKKPSTEHSLDRYPNVNGNYEPSNCRWATLIQQGRNKRNNIIIKFKGVEYPLSQWSKIFNIPYMKLYSAHKKGKDSVKLLLKDNPEMLEEIENKVKNYSQT